MGWLIVLAVWAWMARKMRKAQERLMAPETSQTRKMPHPFADHVGLPKNIKDSYVLKDGDVSEDFREWYETKLTEPGSPHAAFRADRGGIPMFTAEERAKAMQNRPRPIPSSAQLINEYAEMEAARAYSVCACGHMLREHSGGFCRGLHDAKPCVCPRFNG